jgi:guanine nucleotide-binding protein subunit alpha, other
VLFKDISNSPFFERAALVLFLNKIDLLHEKLRTGLSPIRRFYPDYIGNPTDIQAGQDYFANKFKRLYRNTEKTLYLYFTNATDTNLLKVTMKSVQLMILQHNFTTLIL